jgi:hypothetical protein
MITIEFKYHLGQEVVDLDGQHGTIISEAHDWQGNYYQLLCRSKAHWRKEENLTLYVKEDANEPNV